MDLYTLIYDFIHHSLFAGADARLGDYEIGGLSFEGVEWLSHTITIVILILLIVCLCCFVKWLVKTIGGLIA